MKPLISVIVPVYKVEKYLHNCVDSILNQSYKNIEIILIDDGSSDGCPSICDEYVKKDNRVVVIHKKNGGLSDARNAGINVAKGKYITFVDSDDTVREDYIKQLYETVEENSADIAICGHTAIYGNNNIEYSSNNRGLLTQKEALERILYHKDFNSSSWAKMYERSLFRDICFPKGENYEDTSTTYKLFLRSKRIGYNLKSQYNYIIRNDSIMTHSFDEKDLLLIESWKKMASCIVEKYPDLKNGAIRGVAYARFCILRKAINATERSKALEKNLKKEILKDKKTLLFDKNCPKRDKIAILLLYLGIPVFKKCWNTYVIITKRETR